MGVVSAPFTTVSVCLSPVLFLTVVSTSACSTLSWVSILTESRVISLALPQNLPLPRLLPSPLVMLRILSTPSAVVSRCSQRSLLKSGFTRELWTASPNYEGGGCRCHVQGCWGERSSYRWICTSARALRRDQGHVGLIFGVTKSYEH